MRSAFTFPIAQQDNSVASHRIASHRIAARRKRTRALLSRRIRDNAHHLSLLSRYGPDDNNNNNDETRSMHLGQLRLCQPHGLLTSVIPRLRARRAARRAHQLIVPSNPEEPSLAICLKQNTPLAKQAFTHCEMILQVFRHRLSTSAICQAKKQGAGRGEEGGRNRSWDSRIKPSETEAQSAAL
ncbi:hypothetical protein CCHR01_10799 [Colletotrichum chrysophilum]|uniref:Uncharacterized protein n=1 Tax=Colletotrichum chrysophilum TaxID=1836956 RepID=A0AAD9EGG2_9PEZI|nr:hypothetical protein CCHR01_10799 [Colletotrichum chrysophilum]